MHNVLHRVPNLSRLVQVGIRDLCDTEAERIAKSGGQIRTFFDSDLASAAHAGTPWGKTCEAIVAELPGEVYISFDIDGLDPTLCPHTGTPVPGAVVCSDGDALANAGALAAAHRRFDLTEVAPTPLPLACSARPTATRPKMTGTATLGLRCCTS